MIELGLIGCSLKHSFSSIFFEKYFHNKKLNNYSYTNFEIDNISQILNIIYTNNDLIGLNITIPYKQSIIPYLDNIDSTAVEIGAINTLKIRRENEIIINGYNTDWIGFNKSIEEYLPKLKNAIILGNGGASLAIKYVLKKHKILFQTYCRNPKNNTEYMLQNLTNNVINDAKLIIQTTPVGTFPDIGNCIDFPFDGINENHICMDLIYNPQETLFLNKCKQNGATTINGLTMLETQALESFKIWSLD